MKKPWQSKMMLMNGLGGLVAFVCLFYPGAEVVSAWIGGHAVEIGMAWSFANMALRWITKDAIQLVD